MNPNFETGASRTRTWGTALAGATTAAAVTVLAQPPALALDLDSQGDLITDTVADQERRRRWDPAKLYGVRPITELDRSFAQPDGIRLGNFMFFPTVSETIIYDDNIFGSGEDVVPDVKFITAPSLTLQSRLPRHAFDATLAGRIVNYAANPDQNYANVGALIRGALNVDHAHTLSLSALSSLDHEERQDSTAPRDAAEPVPVFRNRLSAGVTRDAGRLYGTLSATAEHLDYSDVRATDGSTLDQDDRDQTIVSGQLRSGYRFSPGFELVSKLRLVRTINEIDDGISDDRNATGYEALAGLSFEQDALISWRLLGGYGVRDYDSEQYDSVASSLLEAEVRWLPTERLTLLAHASRALVDEIGDEDNGRVETTIGASAAMELRHDLVGRLRLDYSDQDFSGSSRRDDVITAGADLDWYLGKNWQLTLGYAFETRDSSEDEFDFTRNQIRVGAKLKF